MSNVERLVQHCRDACHWMVGMLGSQQGNGYLKPFLLECTSKEVRHAFSTVLSSAMHSYIGFGASTVSDEDIVLGLSVVKQHCE